MITVPKSDIPAISVDQMKQIDRLMVKEIGVPIQIMMENAGRNIADLIRYLAEDSVLQSKIIVLSGMGNNGGGVLVAARHLLNYGAQVTVILSSPEDTLKEDPKLQLEILKNTNVSIFQFVQLDTNKIKQLMEDADFILDGLIGYRLKGSPREPISDMIEMANTADAPVVSNDIPSGLNGDTGKPMDPTINAFATVTLALPKKGLYADSAKEYVSDLYLADVSVPRSVYLSIGIPVDEIFPLGNVIKLEDE